MSADKFPVFVTQEARFNIKSRLICAERGRDLLNKKLDSLSIKFREIFAELLKRKLEIEQIMKSASFSLAEVKFVIGNINKTVIEGVDRARVKLTFKEDLIGGMKIENFDWFEAGGDNYEYAGLAGGRQQILRLKENYRKAFDCLVRLASLRRNILTLNDVINKIRRRVNALKQTIIPKLQRTLAYVTMELDEYEREEFFRLKRIQKKKCNVISRDCREVENTLPERSIFEDEEDILF